MSFLISPEKAVQLVHHPDYLFFDATFLLPNMSRDAAAEYQDKHIEGAQFFDIDAIADVMSEAGEIAMSGGQRLSFHPGPFNCLGSPNEDVVKKTIAELDAHSIQMDLMGLPESPQA